MPSLLHGGIYVRYDAYTCRLFVDLCRSRAFTSMFNLLLLICTTLIMMMMMIDHTKSNKHMYICMHDGGMRVEGSGSIEQFLCLSVYSIAARLDGFVSTRPLLKRSNYLWLYRHKLLWWHGMTNLLIPFSFLFKKNPNEYCLCVCGGLY